MCLQRGKRDLIFFFFSLFKVKLETKLEIPFLKQRFLIILLLLFIELRISNFNTRIIAHHLRTRIVRKKFSRVILLPSRFQPEATHFSNVIVATANDLWPTSCCLNRRRERKRERNCFLRNGDNGSSIVNTRNRERGTSNAGGARMNWLSFVIRYWRAALTSCFSILPQIFRSIDFSCSEKNVVASIIIRLIFSNMYLLRARWKIRQYRSSIKFRTKIIDNHF